MMVDILSMHNAIISRPTLNRLRAMISTYHIIMKFLIRDNIGELRSNLKELHQCYLTIISLPKKVRPKAPLVDPQDMDKSTPHPEPVKPLIEVPLDTT